MRITVFCKSGFEKAKEKMTGITIRGTKIEKSKEKSEILTNRINISQLSDGDPSGKAHRAEDRLQQNPGNN